MDEGLSMMMLGSFLYDMEKINEMFENTSKGFLYKETIYRVKKND